MADKEFDWVSARSECSALHVFNTLRLGVEEDAKAFNKTSAVVAKMRSPVEVRSNTLKDYFVVYLAGNSTVKVEFNCERDWIKVTKGEEEHSVTLTLNNQGACRLRIDGGEELEQWQVRRAMLEELFFGPLGALLV